MTEKTAKTEKTENSKKPFPYVTISFALKGDLQRLTKRSEFVDHHLNLSFGEEGWGFAHLYAFLKFVLPTARSRLSVAGRAVYDSIDLKDLEVEYLNRVPIEIREGTHWDFTSVRGRRWSGKAEEAWRNQ